MIPTLLHVYGVWLALAVAGAGPSIFFYVKGRSNA